MSNLLSLAKIRIILLWGRKPSRSMKQSINSFLLLALYKDLWGIPRL